MQRLEDKLYEAKRNESAYNDTKAVIAELNSDPKAGAIMHAIRKSYSFQKRMIGEIPDVQKIVRFNLDDITVSSGLGYSDVLNYIKTVFEPLGIIKKVQNKVGDVYRAGTRFSRCMTILKTQEKMDNLNIGKASTFYDSD